MKAIIDELEVCEACSNDVEGIQAILGKGYACVDYSHNSSSPFECDACGCTSTEYTRFISNTAYQELSRDDLRNLDRLGLGYVV